MRKKLVSMIILLVALAMLTIGILEAQYGLINNFYDRMSSFT